MRRALWLFAVLWCSGGIVISLAANANTAQGRLTESVKHADADLGMGSLTFLNGNGAPFTSGDTAIIVKVGINRGYLGSRQRMLLAAMHVFKAIYDNGPDIQEASIVFLGKGLDPRHPTPIGPAMSVSLSRKTAFRKDVHRIIWDKFDFDRLPQIADKYSCREDLGCQ